MSGARLADRAIVEGFRERLARILRAAATALDGRVDEVLSAREWLRGERLPYWRRQWREREDAVQEARRRWALAESDVQRALHGRGGGKASSTEERLVLLRAQRVRDEAEAKLAAVRSWLARLDAEAEPLVQACRNLDLALQDGGAAALARLERIAAEVRAYLALRTAPALPLADPGASGPGGGP